MLRLPLSNLHLDAGEGLDAFLAQTPVPTGSQIVAFLKTYPFGRMRDLAAQTLVARGVDPGATGAALAYLGSPAQFNWSILWGLLSTASMAASAYHGYRRNQSIGWAIWWGLMGGIFPVFTPVIAVAQGFGKRKAD